MRTIISLVSLKNLALRPFAKRDGWDINQAPEDIRPPDAERDGDARSHEPAHEAVGSLDAGDVLPQPQLEGESHSLEDHTVDEVEGVGDLAKILHNTRLIVSLPERQVAN